MSDSPDPEQEIPGGDPEELIKKTKEAVESKTEEHNALLEAAAEGEEALIEETDTAEIGDATLTVSTQLTGETARKVDAFQEGNIPPGQMLDTVVQLLTEQTKAIEATADGKHVEFESEADISAFFRRFLNNHDINTAAEICIRRVIEKPNEMERERRQEAVKSFRPNRESRSDWTRRRNK